MDENRTSELNKALEGVWDGLADETVEEIWDSLTDEQKAKARECQSMDELVELAGKEGVELSDEMLDAIAGGYVTSEKHGNLYMYRAIRDDNGKTIASFRSADDARKCAKREGWSMQYLNRSEFRKRYGC